MAKTKEKRKRLAITATSVEEMQRFEQLLGTLFPHAKPSTAAKMLLMHLCDNIDAARDLVTTGNQREPLVTSGVQREPMDACPNPARALKSSSSQDQKNGKNKKKKDPRLAPLNVSERVVGYLNDQAGLKLRHKAEGHRLHIQRRLNKGATEEQLCEVIRKMTIAWGGTDMARHLNPETLFGPKFDKYLDSPESVPRGGNSDGQQRQMKFAARQDKSKYLTGQEEEIDDKDAPPF